MRVLVIGGSGHVGTLVLPYLADKHELTVLDLKPPVDVEGVTFVEGSLLDYDAVTRAMETARAEALLFMAMGPQAPWASPSTALGNLEVAVPGLYAALRVAHEHGVEHAVYTSSMSVFSAPHLRLRDDSGRYPDEQVPPDARDFYGLAKRLGEEVARNAVTDWGMSIVALRLCHPTANDEWPRTKNVEQATISTSARDTAAAILAGLEYSGGGFEAFGVSGDGGEQMMSLAKARDVLGWSPQDSTADR